MKKFRNILLLLLITIGLASCDTSLPIPIVGSYRVSEFEEENYDYYYLQLNEDNTFTLCQTGGGTEGTGFLFKGNWSMDMTAFNFKRANGILTLTDVEGPTEFSNLILTPGVVNRYRFTWIKDPDSAKATLSLESTNRYICGDIATGFLITEKKFNELVDIAMGIVRDETEGENGTEVPEGDQSNEG